MLPEGSGKYVQWPPCSGMSDHLRRGGKPVRLIYGLPRRREALCPVRPILGSWGQRLLVLAKLSPHLTPCNTNGPAGPARRPFS